MMEASEFIRLAEQDKSTTLDRIGDIIGNGCTTDIESDKAEHNMPETEKYFYRLTKVIIENSRDLRLGFFIELAEYFIFIFIFKLLCVHKDEKQQ